jgi:hypothetical protein
VSKRELWLVTHVLPNPAYPLELFRDIRFPVGTTVSELVDGKVVRTYVEPAESGRDFGWSTSLLIVVLALTIILALFWISRRKNLP